MVQMHYTVAGAPNTPSVVTNGGNEDTPVDNAFYRFINGVQPANDVAMNKLTFSPFGGAGATVNITGEVLNAGSSPITSLAIKYTANGSTVKLLI